MNIPTKWTATLAAGTALIASGLAVSVAAQATSEDADQDRLQPEVSVIDEGTTGIEFQTTLESGLTQEEHEEHVPLLEKALRENAGE